MRVYKLTFWATLAMTTVSFFGACFFQINSIYENHEFIANISLSIFGSSFLTLISALLGYLHAKKKLFESIYYHMVQLRNQFSRIIYYNALDMNYWFKNFEKKFPSKTKEEEETKKLFFELFLASDNIEIQYLLDLYNKPELDDSIKSYISLNLNTDMHELGDDYSDLNFLFFNKKQKKWIYDEIYNYLKIVVDKIDASKNKFSKHVSGNGNIVSVIENIRELQKIMFRYIKSENEKNLTIKVYFKFLDKLNFLLEGWKARLYHCKRESIDIQPIVTQYINKKQIEEEILLNARK